MSITQVKWKTQSQTDLQFFLKALALCQELEPLAAVWWLCPKEQLALFLWPQNVSHWRQILDNIDIKQRVLQHCRLPENEFRDCFSGLHFSRGWVHYKTFLLPVTYIIWPDTVLRHKTIRLVAMTFNLNNNNNNLKNWTHVTFSNNFNKHGHQ